MRIIIRTPNFIGDTIMMLPSLKLIQNHYKDAKITILCPPSCKDLFRGYGINEIIIDDTKRDKRVKNSIKLIKKLRKKHYNLGILFHNALSSALIFKCAKIDTLIGYKNGGREILLDFAPKINRSRHYINHYANLINLYFGEKFDTLPDMRLFTSKQNLIKRSKKKIVALVLGTNKGDRGYPMELSKKLCKLLAKKDYQIIFLGDQNDKKANSIYHEIISDSIDLTAKTTVAEFIDIIAFVDLLVTIDTSAMHIAAATNTKFITLLGQGTSPFSVVKPKVDFGSYLFCGERYIKDSDLISSISPKMIVDEIEKRLS